MSQPPVVIVVDDDAGMSRAMARMIEAGGMTAMLYGSAEAMLADAREADCIVIDVQLPGMDGFQLYEALASRGSRVPVVFISASEEAEARARELEDPLVTFVAKPLSGRALLETLKSVLDEARGCAARPGGKRYL